MTDKGTDFPNRRRRCGPGTHAGRAAPFRAKRQREVAEDISAGGLLRAIREAPLELLGPTP
jgi:hypothetical protein